MVNFFFWRGRQQAEVPAAPEPEPPPPRPGESFDLVFGPNAAGLGRGGTARRSVVIIGSDLAEAIRATLSAMPEAAGHCTFECISLKQKSLDEPLVRKTVGNAAVVLVQAIAGLDIEAVRAMGLGADVVVFPDLAMCGMWPFDAVNGARDPVLESRPDCPIRHPDAALVQLRQIEPDKKKRLQRYIELDFPAASIVAPAAEAQEKFLLQIDQTTDLKLGRFIARSYRDTPLFYNSTSPTGMLMQQLCELAWIKLKITQNIPDFPDLAAQKQWSVPVHPAVARKLGLVWASGATKYTYGTLGEVTWREWVEVYLDKLG